MKRTLIIAIAFAILAAFFSYVFLSDLETKYKTMNEPINVIVANKRIPQGTLIQKDMLAIKQMPKEYIQPKVFTKAESLFNKDGTPIYISLNTIEAGEQILSTKISSISQETGISNIIPENYKALVVSFDSESSTVISPGSRIDILGTIVYTDKNKQFQESVYSVVQNILVLAVGNNYIGTVKKQGEESTYSRNPYLTLAVKVEDAQKIIMAGEKGLLKYIIRPIGDDEINDIKPLKLSDMIKDISMTTAPIGNRSSKPRNLNSNEREIIEMLNKYTSENK